MSPHENQSEAVKQALEARRLTLEDSPGQKKIRAREKLRAKILSFQPALSTKTRRLIKKAAADTGISTDDIIVDLAQVDISLGAWLLAELGEMSFEGLFASELKDAVSFSNHIKYAYGNDKIEKYRQSGLDRGLRRFLRSPSHKRTDYLLGRYEDVTGQPYPWSEKEKIQICSLKTKQDMQSYEEKILIPHLIKKISEVQRKKQPLRLVVVQAYIKLCEAENVKKPSIQQLENETKFSKSTIQRALQDPAVLLELKRHATKKRNLAKSQDKKDLWIGVLFELENLTYSFTKNKRNWREKPAGDMSNYRNEEDPS